MYNLWFIIVIAASRHNSLVVLGLSYLCVTLLDSIVHSGLTVLLLWSCYSRTLCINAALVISGLILILMLIVAVVTVVS